MQRKWQGRKVEITDEQRAKIEAERRQQLIERQKRLSIGENLIDCLLFELMFGCSQIWSVVVGVGLFDCIRKVSSCLKKDFGGKWTTRDAHI